MNIPAALTQRPQWVTWRYEEDPAHPDKPKKIPCNPRTGGNAMSNNADTWSSYVGACRAAKRYSHRGMGYMFGLDDGFVGIDLDGCRNPETGEIAPWGKDALDRLNSYSEVSPSGRGVKVIVEGKIVKALKRSLGEHTGVEVYNRGRFFTVTGERLEDYPACITASQEAIDWLIATYTPSPVTKPATLPHPVLPANDHAARWAEEKLTWIEDQIRSEPAGNLHNRRLELGKLAGGIVALGLLDEDYAIQRILAARPPASHEAAERKAISDGIATGRSSPLTLPTFPTEQALIISDGVACCPSCTTQVIRSKFDYPGTTTSGWYCPRCKSPMVWPIEAWAPPTPAQQTETTYVVADWEQAGITLAELQQKHFEPERWIIENVLPEGACLLAAKYKSKKSWLALALGCAVAMGGRALGRLAVSSGRVLYLDLEGRQQRIQKRTRAMLGVSNTRWPDNFHVFTEWPQGEAGFDQLVKWFQRFPDTSMVICDVLADLRRPPDRYELPYVYDRSTVKPFNQLGEYYHAAVMLVHHFNKAKNDDIMDSISGTTGLPSAVNTMWGLARDVNDSAITVLNLRGRDLENDEPLALKWDGYLCQHVIEGPANEIATSAERRAVLAVFADDGTYTPQKIAEQLGKPVSAVKMLLRPLLDNGLIDKVGYGKYARIAYSAYSAYSPDAPYSAYSSEKDEGRSDSNGSEQSRVSEAGESKTPGLLFGGQQDALNPKSKQSKTGNTPSTEEGLERIRAATEFQIQQRARRAAEHRQDEEGWKTIEGY